MNSLEELDREDLLFLIGCYNNYVVDFFEEHEEGMYPVSVYEFYENEFQDIIKEETENELYR